MNVKICGITCLEDALVAVEAGADALGFNFAEEAKAKGRYIDPDAARNIVEQLPDTVLSVAVTVNEEQGVKGVGTAMIWSAPLPSPLGSST